jgi:site-specific recombinase XerD
MSIKNDLRHSILNVLKHNRHGSYSTQAGRRDILTQFANELVQLGYGLRDIRGLKTKHIQAIIKFWQENKLATSTIKNRMAVLRFLCEKINKHNLIEKNASLGIGKRKYVPDRNIAIFNPDFSRISNHHVRVSLELQRAFGLRREESIKIKPHLADKGDKLELFPSWCKGGRGRVIEIKTEEQRNWLDEAKKLAMTFGNSLIPKDKNYIKQCHVYDKQVSRAGLKRMHGLRHAYAQQRYKELAGWEAPINGGPKTRELTSEQKQIDLEARTILTESLGHSRLSILRSYLGS